LDLLEAIQLTIQIFKMASLTVHHLPQDIIQIIWQYLSPNARLLNRRFNMFYMWAITNEKLIKNVDLQEYNSAVNRRLLALKNTVLGYKLNRKIILKEMGGYVNWFDRHYRLATVKNYDMMKTLYKNVLTDYYLLVENQKITRKYRNEEIKLWEFNRFLKYEPRAQILKNNI